MEALALAICMLGLEAVPHYDPHNDRRRFPPDEVLVEWRKNTAQYKTKLEEQKEHLWAYREDVRYELAAAIEREINECRRLDCIYTGLIPCMPDPVNMKSWMLHARQHMTEEEYRLGYVSFMGLPQFSLSRLPRPK